MVLIAFVLFVALILAWLASPGEAKEKRVSPVGGLEPIATPAD